MRHNSISIFIATLILAHFPNTTTALSIKSQLHAQRQIDQPQPHVQKRWIVSFKNTLTEADIDDHIDEVFGNHVVEIENDKRSKRRKVKRSYVSKHKHNNVTDNESIILSVGKSIINGSQIRIIPDNADLEKLKDNLNVVDMEEDSLFHVSAVQAWNVPWGLQVRFIKSNFCFVVKNLTTLTHC